MNGGNSPDAVVCFYLFNFIKFLLKYVMIKKYIYIYIYSIIINNIEVITLWSKKKGLLLFGSRKIGSQQGRITVKDIGWAITKRAKHAKSRGVWGHAPPGNF